MIGFAEADGACALAEENEKLAAAKQAARKTGECRFKERNGMCTYLIRTLGRFLSTLMVVGAFTVISAPVSGIVVVLGAGAFERLAITLLTVVCVVTVINKLLGEVVVLLDVGAFTKPPKLATSVPVELATSPALTSNGDAAKVVEMPPPTF